LAPVREAHTYINKSPLLTAEIFIRILDELLNMDARNKSARLADAL